MPQPAAARWRRPSLCLAGSLCFLAAGCGADAGLVDFGDLKRSATPNDALACPPGRCSARADLLTGEVALDAQSLAARVVDTILREPRTELAGRSDDGLHLVFVQRSRLFRFPDTVNVEVAANAGGGSSVAIYSRSNYGYGDLGVNLARIRDWLARIGVPARAD